MLFRSLACCTRWCFVGHWPARCVERPAHRIWALLAIDVVEISRHAHATSPIGKTMRAPISRAVAWAASRPTFVPRRSEEHTSELQSLMRISYAVFCLKKKNTTHKNHPTQTIYVTM